MGPRKGQRMKPDSERRSASLIIRLTPDEHKALERTAAREKMSISWLVREGIALIITKYDQHSKKLRVK